MPPVGIALALTAIACAIAPDKPRDLGTQAFVDPRIVATHTYFIAYAFALMLCAVAEYFVSAKRFADRGKPGAFAGLAPFALLLAGAANWYQPRSEGTMPAALTYVSISSRSALSPGMCSNSAWAPDVEHESFVSCKHMASLSIVLFIRPIGG